MAQDWTADVKKYIRARTRRVDHIVKYLGIALQSRTRPTSPAAASSSAIGLRNSFLKASWDYRRPMPIWSRSISRSTKMKGDRTKSRVAFYYLLAEKYQKLSLFSA